LSGYGIMGGDGIGRLRIQESLQLSGRGRPGRKADRATTERHQPPAFFLRGDMWRR
jgi:hypothetical protein